MRDRHEHQVEDLRATLEASLNAPDARPSRWTPQLVDMRRQQKRLVRERKFGEALDLLKAAETREAEEIEWHRQTMRREHVKALESLFERQAEERAVFLRECQREEERLETKRMKLARGLTRDGGKAVEEEAAVRVDAARPSFPKPRAPRKTQPEPTAAERAKAIGRRVQTKPSLPDAARGGRGSGVDHARGGAGGEKRTGRDGYDGGRREEVRSRSEGVPELYPVRDDDEHEHEHDLLHGEDDRLNTARASLPSTRPSAGSYGGSSSYDLTPQRASPTGESPAVGVTVASRAFYDDTGGVADRLVMRYGPDSVRAHESVAGGEPPSGIEVAIPVAMPVSSVDPESFRPSRPTASFPPPFPPPVPPPGHPPVLGYEFESQRAEHEAWMAQQRAWIAAGLAPPPPHFMPYGTHHRDAAAGTNASPSQAGGEDTTTTTTTTTDETRDDGGRRTGEDGLEGAEAKLAADGLMSAALAMAGAGADRGGGRAKKSTAEVRKEEERVALETAALEAGEELSDDDVDDGMDDLDDVDLVSPGWRNNRATNPNASSRNGPGLNGLNVGLNVRGVGGYVTGVSSPGPLAAPRRMAGPSQFDATSAPASAAEVRAGIRVRGETNPENPTTNPTTNPKPPPLEAARGVVVERARDGERDAIRDLPNVARGAAILRRLHGPEDGYRSKRESSGDPGVHGALGFPENENLRGERDDAGSTTEGGTNEDDDFVRVGALAKSHARSVGTAARTSEVRDMRAAFALMSNARSPLHAARMSEKMLNGVRRRSNDEVSDDPFAPSPGNRKSSVSSARDFRERSGSSANDGANDDPFAPSPPPRRGTFVAMQTAGLSGTFLDAAKADAKADKGSDKAVARATREATRIADLDASFAPAAGDGHAGAHAAAMTAARSAAFEYGAASRPPPTDAFGRRLERVVDSGPKPRAETKTTAPGSENPAPGFENPRLPIPAVGDDVDVVSGLRKAQLDAAARRAMTDAKMTRERGDAGLAKGEVSSGPSRPLRGRRMTNKANGDAGTAGGESMPPGGSPGGSSVRSDAFSDRANTSAAPRATAEDVVNLFKLFRKGKYDDARALLKRPGMSVDVRDKFGNTPLLVACQNGHGRLAKMCVRYGADVNAANNKRNTALHFAVQYGFDALADFLVEKGANRDARNDDGRTPHEGL